ncbi:MAG: glucose-1-phosphate thymidylyltransferase [Candidatus Aenigmarchaeota archaeon]|nr:glucose-1-phosphate thymidylyltransferase [Candidatus Aenigmarchaeota archaeon]
MKGLILAGGHGTRLRPITHTSNKHLIPLANKPMLYYAIETLRNAGIKDIGIIVGHTPQRIQEIKDAIGDGSKFGVSVTYIEQDAPRGLAHAIGVAKEYLTSNNADGKFVVHLGDNIIKGGIKKYVEKFSEPGIDSLILLKSIQNPNRFGVAEIKNGKIVRLVEKPQIPPSDLAMVGVYMLNSSIFDSIEKLKPSARGEYEITEAVQGVIDSGKNVHHEIIDAEWWKDPGDPDGILEANRFLLEELVPFNKGTVEEGSNIVGKVCIEEGAVIKKGSSIRGPVIIGKNCVVGENAYIGPYTAIGDNTIVNNAEIESSVVIGDCKIECKGRIIDSLIGKNVTIISSDKNSPKASKLVVGENSFLSI